MGLIREGFCGEVCYHVAFHCGAGAALFAIMRKRDVLLFGRKDVYHGCVAFRLISIAGVVVDSAFECLNVVALRVEACQKASRCGVHDYDDVLVNTSFHLQLYVPHFWAPQRRGSYRC